MTVYTGIGGHSSDEDTQTERLIRAINELTGEVRRTNDAHKNTHVEQDIHQAVRALQVALNTREDGIIGSIDMKELRRHGAAIPNKI